ncbi:MAG: rhomboid family intramembrane serine protease [Candidatus Altiarchaeota archaeon]|nr:rhomboid family intramembrane serine protease [Candidatus Altiarchaeota archaeon]
MRFAGYTMGSVEALITLNVLAFFLMLFNPGPIFSMFALSPAEFMKQPWTLLTSMFLHAGIYHLMFNMIALFFFGLYLERLVGENEFLKIYFFGGLFAGIAYLFTSLAFNMPPPDIAAVGASGAIFAVMGVLVVLRPKLLIFVYFVPMPLYIYAVIYTLWALFEMMGSMDMGGGIAHNAHLGGLIAGLYFGMRLKKKRGYDPGGSGGVYRYY